MCLHKSVWDLPAAAAFPEPSGFHRETGMIPAGFPQDSTGLHPDFFAGSESCKAAKTVLILEGILIFFTGFFAPVQGKFGMLTPYI